MKKIIFLLCSVFLFVSCTKNQFTHISMEDLAHRIQAESDYILLDVRTPEEFSTGHIPGAICIPNESIGKQEIPALPDKKQRIYIYCRSGSRSKQAADKLIELGYTNLVEAGGIMNWQGEIEVGR